MATWHQLAQTHSPDDLIHVACAALTMRCDAPTARKRLISAGIANGLPMSDKIPQRDLLVIACKQVQSPFRIVKDATGLQSFSADVVRDQQSLVQMGATQFHTLPQRMYAGNPEPATFADGGRKVHIAHKPTLDQLDARRR